jgi:carbon storage regulator
MLVLTRRIGEEIVIGDDIRVKITGIIDNAVRIGITAPETVRVDREEIHLRRGVAVAQANRPPESRWVAAGKSSIRPSPT